MKKVRVGVVGLGMGRYHIKDYQKDRRVEVAAGCDINAKRVEQVCDEHGVEGRYTDLKKMLREAKLDAVSIATPNKFHAPQTIAALKAGLHVLCEKPMAMSAQEGERMKVAAKKARRNLMISFNQRFDPVPWAAKQQVETGVLGEIYFGRTVWHRRRGVPGLGGWFTNKALSGGGPLIDLGVHRLDLALWLMGFPKPVSVSGSTYCKIANKIAKKARKSYDVEDVACGLVKFDNGATLIVEASWALNIGRRHLLTTLCGDKGGLCYGHMHGGKEPVAEIYTEEKGLLFTKTLDSSSIRPPSPRAEFVSSILEKRQPLATADHGIKVMRILDGIYKSAKLGKEVRYRS